MRILAFDPGGTTGVVTLNSEDKVPLEEYEELSIPGLYRKLDNPPETWTTVDLVIIEDFTIDPKKWKAHEHSRVPTIKVIGAIEFFAWRYDRKTFLQNRSIKPVGYGWLGMQNAHGHWQDAFVHGMYYMIKRKIVPHPHGGLRLVR